MSPEAYLQLARQAGQQAHSLSTLARQYARLRQSVLSTMGGTATRRDREMCDLLETASHNATKAAEAFGDAKRRAEEAAAKAQHERAQASRQGRKRSG